MGAIDERLGEVELSASLQIFSERVENALERAVAHPVLKSPMARLIRRVSRRQIFPRRSGTQNPEHAVKHVSRVAVWTASHASLSRFLDGKQRPQKRPLLIGEVHCNL